MFCSIDFYIRFNKELKTRTNHIKELTELLCPILK